MLSQSRNLMQRVLSKNKPSEEQINEAIKRGEQLAALVKMPGWKHIESFIETNRIGTHAYMEKEVTAVSTFTIASLFSTYAKYLMLLFENRAYTKIKTYVRVSIQSGQKFKAQQAERERASNAQSGDGK